MSKENIGTNNKENLAKTRYFSDFALKNLSEMKILKKGGILGKENKNWRNISEHCLAEAVGADILAEHLGADRDAVVEAALIHDWYKRREIEAMKKTDGAFGYEKTAEEDESFLREFGIDEIMIKLSHSNIPERADFEYLKNRSMEEKIIHFIDTILSGSEFVDFNERLRVVEQKKHNVEFSESFRDKYSGKSLFEVQRETIIIEQQEFEETLNLQPGELINFIKEKLEERINNFQ